MTSLYAEDQFDSSQSDQSLLTLKFASSSQLRSLKFIPLLPSSPLRSLKFIPLLPSSPAPAPTQNQLSSEQTLLAQKLKELKKFLGQTPQHDFFELFLMDSSIKFNLLSFINPDSDITCEKCKILNDIDDQDYKKGLIDETNSGQDCLSNDIIPRLATFVSICQEEIQFESDDKQADNQVKFTFYCAQCYYDDPCYSYSVFSKPEIRQLFSSFTEEKINHLNAKRMTKLVAKLLILQSRSKVQSNAEQEEYIAQTVPRINDLPIILFTNTVVANAEKKLNNFRIREHRKIEDRIEKARQQMNDDLCIMKNLLCSTKDWKRNLDSKSQQNPSISLLNFILEDERFKDLLGKQEDDKQQYNYYDDDVDFFYLRAEDNTD